MEISNTSFKYLVLRLCIVTVLFHLAVLCDLGICQFSFCYICAYIGLFIRYTSDILIFSNFLSLQRIFLSPGIHNLKTLGRPNAC